MKKIIIFKKKKKITYSFTIVKKTEIVYKFIEEKVSKANHLRISQPYTK